MQNDSHAYRVDNFIVPPAARNAFLERVKETHGQLEKLPGFVRDFVLEKSDGSGRFNFITLVEWESHEKFTLAKAAMREVQVKSGFDLQLFFRSAGITSDLGNYQNSDLSKK